MAVSSFYKRIFGFLGSIKFAIPLLALITGILIWATFYESQVGSSTAQQTIYKSPWFGALMFLLATNLTISALSRYPWRTPRKIGFALTHLGLVVIIAGSAAVIHLGVEGMLLVRTDSPPNNQIRVEGELLELLTPNQEHQQTSITTYPDGHVTPTQFAGLSLLQYQENTIKTVRFTEEATVNNPAVKLHLASQRMGQTLDRWLAVAPQPYRQVPVGPATLEIKQAESETQLQNFLAEPQPSQANQGSLEITHNTQNTTLEVATALRHPQTVSNTLQLTVQNFWPDFRLNANNQPISASDQLNNPAIQLEITTPQGQERWFVFSQPNIPPVRTLIAGQPLDNLDITYTVTPPEPDAYFRLLVAPSGKLFYAAKSSHNFQSGAIRVGDTVHPGWADFAITLAEYIPHGQVQRQVVPVATPQPSGTPALQVQTPQGQKTWLPWGEPTTLETDQGDLFAAFTPKLLQLPFAVQLDDFIVERNEGSESVAMWTSKIRILDPETEAPLERDVWMNHPTWYRGWKIAQASWNPGDLSQSTLQVKREPLWVTATTWTGSALVILGIATMFYGRSLTQKVKQLSVTPETPENSVEPQFSTLNS
ncbi:MAG: cytochrome c biogenesis protein ResB [Kamptonema sp. SIO4C4]|nr:cytochrome c biogenesis protein ResB [Kamptonema sp. SIO4C4]